MSGVYKTANDAALDVSYEEINPSNSVVNLVKNDDMTVPLRSSLQSKNFNL